jgi:glycerol-3-phosphate O-acyltransferase
MSDHLRTLWISTLRTVLGWITKPSVHGAEKIDNARVCYVLADRSDADLAMLDLVARREGLTPPGDPIPDCPTRRRYLFLSRGSRRLLRRNLIRSYAERVRSLEANMHELRDLDLELIPVTVFWSRAPAKERALFRVLLSENWRFTSRFRRLTMLLFNRRHIRVQFGTPVALADTVDEQSSDNRIARRIARLMRVQHKNQRSAMLGPNLSHRTTLINRIVNSRAVRAAIDAEAARSNRSARKVRNSARRDATKIVSDMSNVTVRFLDRLLRWFWNRIYDGVETTGVDRLQAFAERYTLVYVPCHRSHVDYLLVSYILYERGLMIPHVAAGDNLDMPVIGGVLRRGGAFFMRRSFRDDPLYSAVFSEYVFQMLQRGSPIEYFIEGGRSRTGRLLRPKTGLLRATLESQHRGMDRPIAFVPVYVGYEKLIEAGSYQKELRGSEKKKESASDVLKSMRLIRQSFGKVTVNFGEPVVLDEHLDLTVDPSPQRVSELGNLLLQRINCYASVNPINLVALVTLCTPKLAIDEAALIQQIECYTAMLREQRSAITITPLSGKEVIAQAESLNLLTRETHAFGDVLSHDPSSAALMTWYRNNVMHTLALPSLVACLIVNRRRRIALGKLREMVRTIYPYLCSELYIAAPESINETLEAWLARMGAQGLLKLTADSTAPPAGDSVDNFRLRLLAGIVMQTLERFFIVIALLKHAGQNQLDQPTLEDRCQHVAEQMSRFHGLNSPEFFDPQLFHGFVDSLLAQGAIARDAHGKISFTPLVSEVVRAASTVLTPEFRHAVLRAHLKMDALQSVA